MKIDEEDFKSFISIKQSLDVNSVRLCTIRIRVINRWFVDKELTKENIEKFFRELQLSGRKNNTLNCYFFVFSHLRDYFKDRGWVSDFFDGFKSFKKTKADIIILTPDEIEKIYNTQLEYGKQNGRDCSFLDFRYRTLVMFLALTGCRMSEALDLQIKRLDINAGKAIFIETKTNENRTANFSEPLTSKLKVLIEGKKPDDLVFRNSKETRMQITDVSDDLKRRAQAAGITKRVHPHLFRHSFATELLMSGVDVTMVASILGHKDIQTTFENYVHLADQTLKKATMRHPLIRKNINPNEIIKTVKESLEGFHLEDDPRFIYEIVEGNNRLSLNLNVRSSGG